MLSFPQVLFVGAVILHEVAQWKCRLVYKKQHFYATSWKILTPTDKKCQLNLILNCLTLIFTRECCCCGFVSVVFKCYWFILFFTLSVRPLWNHLKYLVRTYHWFCYRFGHCCCWKDCYHQYPIFNLTLISIYLQFSNISFSNY